MNGVHCQTSAAMIAASGLVVIQSGCGALLAEERQILEQRR